jgi:hypothetical protein
LHRSTDCLIGITASESHFASRRPRTATQSNGAAATTGRYTSTNVDRSAAANISTASLKHRLATWTNVAAATGNQHGTSSLATLTSTNTNGDRTTSSSDSCT